MYATGQGTKVDQQEAYRWFLQSAERGEAGAQFEVARRLEEGEGIGKESVLSYSWMLVLQFQQAKFQPEDWKKVQTLTMGVERQLDGAAKLRALEQSRMWMSAIADAEMVSYSQQ
jgi:TPR repeat protein